MDRKFLTAVVAAFVVEFILLFLAHGILLAPDYAAFPAVYRGPTFQPGLFAILLLAMLFTATAMVAIYRFGMQDRPFLGQGFRFGLMAAGMSVIPAYLAGYAVTNISFNLAFKQIIVETIIMAVMGMVIAWVYSR